MRLLIIDGNSVAWTTGYALASFSFRNAKTGIMYSFLKSLLSYYRDYEATTTAIVWDAGKSERKKFYPDYKKARQELTEEERAMRNQILSQVSKVQKLLKDMNFANTFAHPGYEGDDLIASLVNNYKNHPNTEIVVISGDSDLWQLLDDNVFIQSPREDSALLTKENFIKKYGIDPSQWALAKAIAGDTSDSIPGIKGVGINRAVNYLTGKMKETSVFYSRIKESKDIIDRNLKLISLPYEGTPDLKLKRSNSDKSVYVDFLVEHGINSLINKNQLDTATKLFRFKS